MENIRVFQDPAEVALAAAQHIRAAVAAKEGLFHLVLSGGSTPKALYALLAQDPFFSEIDWERVHFWFGDERFVPPSDEQSNERMAREALLNELSLAPDQIHPMYDETEVDEAAESYEAEIRSWLPDGRFDLVLLGIGPDAHTASLFPGEPCLDEKSKWVVPSFGHAGIKQRITLTAPILNIAREVLFLTCGPDKAEPMRWILKQAFEPHKYPAQLVAAGNPNVLWFVDKPATAGL